MNAEQQAALHAAILKTIRTLGMDAFAQTSFFKHKARRAAARKKAA